MSALPPEIQRSHVASDPPIVQALIELVGQPGVVALRTPDGQMISRKFRFPCPVCRGGCGDETYKPLIVDDAGQIRCDPSLGGGPTSSQCFFAGAPNQLLDAIHSMESQPVARTMCERESAPASRQRPGAWPTGRTR